MTTIDVSGETASTGDDSRRLRVWRVQGAAVLGGLLMAGAFPHLDWGWLTWIGLVPILLTIPHLRLRAALAQGFTFGVVYFGGLLYWLAVCGASALGGVGMGLLAWGIAVVAQTLVMLMFVAGSWWLSKRPSRAAWLWGVPALWAVLEWVRGLGQLGTTWGDISVAQHANLPILQLSKLTGPWGVTFVVVLVNVAIAELLRSRVFPNDAVDGRVVQKFAKTAFAVGALSMLGGAVVMHTETLRPTFKVAGLQSGIDPNVAWSGDRPADPVYVYNTMQAYVGAGSEAGRQGASVVIWPETVFPGYLREDYPLAGEVIQEARLYRQTILVGTPERYPVGPEGNALTEVMPDGSIANSYLKRHLVPWGEYVPFRKIFPILDALHLTLYDRKFGDPVQPLFASTRGPIGAVICYESSYPELTREEVARGASLLAIVTDDTWYGRTAAPAQHANFAVLRAVENDRYVIRAAATGISVIVDPNGRVIARAPLFTSKTLIAAVESRRRLTPYSRFGDWFVWACMGVFVAACFAGIRKERN